MIITKYVSFLDDFKFIIADVHIICVMIIKCYEYKIL